MTAHQDTPHRRPRLSTRALMTGFALGVVLTAIAALIVLVWWYRDGTPPLTREALAAARQRWEVSGPASYDVDLKLTGRQQADIHVEVRDGEVAAMSYNGRPPNRKATWAAWSVIGQLEMIARELNNATDANRRRDAFGVTDAAQVVLRAEFDARYGYPRKYYRIVLDPQRKTSDREIAWEVTRFRPLDDTK